MKLRLALPDRFFVGKRGSGYIEDETVLVVGEAVDGTTYRAIVHFQQTDQYRWRSGKCGRCGGNSEQGTLHGERPYCVIIAGNNRMDGLEKTIAFADIVYCVGAVLQADLVQPRLGTGPDIIFLVAMKYVHKVIGQAIPGGKLGEGSDAVALEYDFDQSAESGANPDIAITVKRE